MKTLEEIFDYSRENLENDCMNIKIFDKFVSKTLRVLSNLMHENHTSLDIIKISLILNILSRKADKFGLKYDKIQSLLEILNNSAVVNINYEGKTLSSLLLVFETLEENKLLKHLKINF